MTSIVKTSFSASIEANPLKLNRVDFTQSITPHAFKKNIAPSGIQPGSSHLNVLAVNPKSTTADADAPSTAMRAKLALEYSHKTGPEPLHTAFTPAAQLVVGEVGSTYDSFTVLPAKFSEAQAALKDLSFSDAVSLTGEALLDNPVGTMFDTTTRAALTNFSPRTFLNQAENGIDAVLKNSWQENLALGGSALAVAAAQMMHLGNRFKAIPHSLESFLTHVTERAAKKGRLGSNYPNMPAKDLEREISRAKVTGNWGKADQLEKLQNRQILSQKQNADFEKYAEQQRKIYGESPAKKNFRLRVEADVKRMEDLLKVRAQGPKNFPPELARELRQLENTYSMTPNH